MPSNARTAFDQSALDIRHLVNIHRELRAGRSHTREQLEVLYRSAIVLITAIWEAYCEDIASEAVEHILAHVSTATQLPKELRKSVVAHLKRDQHELAAWRLADEG